MLSLTKTRFDNISNQQQVFTSSRQKASTLAFCHLKKPLQGDLVSFSGKTDNNNKNTVLNKFSQLFFAGSAKSVENTSLYSQFKTENNADSARIIEFLQTTNATPAQIKEFLFAVTSDDKASNTFINNITSDPRKSQQIIKTLMDKLGGEKDYIDWMFVKGGYLQAYDKFNAKFFEQADSVETLLKRQPNWTLWRVKEKYQQKFGNTNFVIGEVPSAFGKRDTFYQLVDFLKNYHSDSVTSKSIDGKTYDIKPLPCGLSDKKSYIIKVDNKKFVIKMDNNPDHCRESEMNKENKALKSDSVFLNTVIDYYLTANNCKNATQVHYYDYYNNAALYEFVEGQPFKKDGDDSDKLNILEMNNLMPDLNALGIVSNDVNTGNFKQQPNGTIKMIDSGESSYSDGLKPGCMGYQANLPNLCGQDLALMMFNIMRARMV